MTENSIEVRKLVKRTINGDHFFYFLFFYLQTLNFATTSSIVKKTVGMIIHSCKNYIHYLDVNMIEYL